MASTAEQYAERHKRAFRVAFDFLNAHFPPQMEPEWWDQAAKDVRTASLEAGEEQLTVQLLSGVYLYLGEEWKRRKCDGADDQQE